MLKYGHSDEFGQISLYPWYLLCDDTSTKAAFLPVVGSATKDHAASVRIAKLVRVLPDVACETPDAERRV